MSTDLGGTHAAADPRGTHATWAPRSACLGVVHASGPPLAIVLLIFIVTCYNNSTFMVT